MNVNTYTAKRTDVRNDRQELLDYIITNRSIVTKANAIQIVDDNHIITTGGIKQK